MGRRVEGTERGKKGLIFLFLYYLKLGSYDLSDDGSLLSSLVVNLRIF